MAAEESGGVTARPEEASTFADALDELKRRGSAILVLGPVGSGVSDAICQRMLGDTLLEDRRRLFVMTDSTIESHAGARATCECLRPDNSQAITYRTGTRSVAAPGTTGIDAVPSTTVDGDLDELMDEIRESIERFDRQADDLDASELRVCLDSVDSLLAHHDDVDVVEFVEEFADYVRAHDGMAHVHLSNGFGVASVDALTPHFDAIVEVEERDEYCQRWHISEHDLTTSWLSL